MMMIVKSTDKRDTIWGVWTLDMSEWASSSGMELIDN